MVRYGSTVVPVMNSQSYTALMFTIAKALRPDEYDAKLLNQVRFYV